MLRVSFDLVPLTNTAPWVLVAFAFAVAPSPRRPVAGPLVGLAAGWLRQAGPVLGGIGAGIVGGVLVGEAVHGIRDLTYSSPHAYWRVQLALGIALAVGLTLWRCRRDPLVAAPALAAALGACAVVGFAAFVAYQFT